MAKEIATGSTWYRQLDGAKLEETLGQIGDKIGARFPDAGLGGVARELGDLCRLSHERIAWIARPIWWLRLPAVLVGVGLAVVGSLLLFHIVRLLASGLSAPELVQTIESEIQLMVFGGFLGLFVWSIERRMKRSRALEALHELRSVIHVIDMHQISKDPDWGSGHDAVGGGAAKNLPDLLRYLDYCCDLLGLAGKVAALYLGETDDPVVVGAVQEVEELATGLAQKIWQKIALLDREASAG